MPNIKIFKHDCDEVDKVELSTFLTSLRAASLEEGFSLAIKLENLILQRRTQPHNSFVENNHHQRDAKSSSSSSRVASDHNEAEEEILIQATKKLADILAQAKAPIVSFETNFCEFRVDGSAILLEALSKQHTLEKLIFQFGRSGRSLAGRGLGSESYYSGMSTFDIDALCLCLQKNKELLTLTLTDYILSAEDIKKLANTLQEHNKKLVCLDLSACGITDEAANFLTPLLRTHGFAKFFLHNNLLTKKGKYPLLKCISQNDKLTYLNVSLTHYGVDVNPHRDYGRNLMLEYQSQKNEDREVKKALAHFVKRKENQVSHKRTNASTQGSESKQQVVAPLENMGSSIPVVDASKRQKVIEQDLSLAPVALLARTEEIPVPPSLVKPQLQISNPPIPAHQSSTAIVINDQAKEQLYKRGLVTTVSNESSSVSHPAPQLPEEKKASCLIM